MTGTLARRRWMTRLAHVVGSDGPKDLSLQEQVVISALVERAKTLLAPGTDEDEPTPYELRVLDQVYRRWVGGKLAADR